MATEFCDKCKQTHPGRTCDYDDKGDCAETIDVSDVGEAPKQESRNKTDVLKGK